MTTNLTPTQELTFTILNDSILDCVDYNVHYFEQNDVCPIFQCVTLAFDVYEMLIDLGFDARLAAGECRIRSWDENNEGPSVNYLLDDLRPRKEIRKYDKENGAFTGHAWVVLKDEGTGEEFIIDPTMGLLEETFAHLDEDYVGPNTIIKDKDSRRCIIHPAFMNVGYTKGEGHVIYDEIKWRTKELEKRYLEQAEEAA